MPKLNLQEALNKLNTSGESAAIESLGSVYLDGAKTFYASTKDMKGRVPRGILGSEQESIGNGAGTSGNNAAGGSKANDPGRTNSSTAPAGFKRNTIASSFRAVQTRTGKFGGSTKLKPTTEAKLKRKGFSVGATPEIPLRPGQNKPKGQA